MESKLYEMLNRRGACFDDSVRRKGTTAVELETRVNIGRLHTIQTNLIGLNLLTSEFDIRHDIEYTYDKMREVLVQNLSGVAEKVTNRLVDILKKSDNLDSFDVSSVTPGLRPDVFSILLFTDAVNMFNEMSDAFKKDKMKLDDNASLEEILGNMRTSLVDVNCEESPYTLSPAQYLKMWDAMCECYMMIDSAKSDAPSKASKHKGERSGTIKKPHVLMKKKKRSGGGGKARVEYDDDGDDLDCEDVSKKFEHMVFQSLSKNELLYIAALAKEYKDEDGNKVYNSLVVKQSILVDELKGLMTKAITLTDDFMSKCMNKEIRKTLYTKLTKGTDLASKFPKKITDQIAILRNMV